MVRNLARRFGSSLVRMGFRRGEVLGMVLPNVPEFPIALLGAAGVGMPVTTVNPIYTAGELDKNKKKANNFHSGKRYTLNKQDTPIYF